MGYLYRRKLRNGKLGRSWWVKYYVSGRHVRESTGTDKESEARRFRGCRIAGITQATITAYALKRQGEGASNATINREVALLIRMLKLAYEAGKLFRLPIIKEAQGERSPSGLL